MEILGSSSTSSPVKSILLFAAPAVTADETKSNVQTTAHFSEKVNRFLSTYCYACHGPDESDTDVKLHNLGQDLVNGPHADDWHEVLDALNLAEMPPEEEKQPSKAERDEVINFLTDAFKKAAAQRRSTGGQVVMRRLTNYEYNHTLNDLPHAFGVS